MRRRWFFTGMGEQNRGKSGAGGLGGIGGTAETARTTREGKEERNIFGPKSQPLQKRPLQSAVQASVPGRERKKRETRIACERG